MIFTHSTPPPTVFTFDTPNDDFTSWPPSHDETIEHLDIISKAPNITSSDFNAASTFIKDQIVNGKEAISSLVSRAFAQTHLSTAQVPTPRETQFHIKSTKLLSQ